MHASRANSALIRVALRAAEPDLYQSFIHCYADYASFKKAMEPDVSSLFPLAQSCRKMHFTAFLVTTGCFVLSVRAQTAVGSVWGQCGGIGW